MGSIGETLRAARETKGVSLQQAEEDTKIRKRYLEALEDEDYDIIPGRVYAKGFLRNYADYLGLSPDEMLMEFKLLGSPVKEEFQKSDIDVSISRKRSNSRKDRRGYLVTVIIVLLAIFTLVVYSFVSQKAPQNNITNNEKPSVSDKTYNPDNDAANKPADKAPDLPDNTAGQVYNNPAAPGNNSQVPPQVPSGQNSRPVNLTLKGKSQVCWVKVIVDGSVKFTGDLNPGAVQTYSGNKVEVTLGNAGAVEVIKNGQNLGVLGPLGDVVTKIFVPDTAVGTAPTGGSTVQPAN